MEKRPFYPDDLTSLVGVSQVGLSPDGSQVVCVISKTDPEKNGVNDFITIITLSNRQQRTIAGGSNPSWSPDGMEIAYEGEDGNLWVYNLKEEQSRLLTKIYKSSYFINHFAENNFAWSPDGQYIAYVSTLPFEETDEEKDHEVKVINKLLYKTKGGRGRPFFTDDRLTHIWIIPGSGGESELITGTNYNEHSIAWSGDGRSIIFISNRSGDPDHIQTNNLWQVNIDTKEVTRLTRDFGMAFQPQPSPDGKSIAFLATTAWFRENCDSPAEDVHLYVMPAAGGVPKCLTEKFDRRIADISWEKNGKHICFTAGDRGRTPLFRISPETGTIESVIDEEMHVLEYSQGEDGKNIAYISTDTTHPPEVFLFDREKKNRMQITAYNEALLQECSMVDAETIWFKSFDGTDIQGWIMKPAAFNSSEKYPLLLVIHGGPHNMSGFDFEDRMQLLASAGYGVLYINPRGSHGYGQTFSSGCVLNWGGGDYKDLMAGVDYVIEHYSWVDREKLGVTGQSYGGYMSNWIITRTDRFKAAVVDGGISNLISFAGTSLYHFLIENEFNGLIYDNFELLWQWSPLRNVKNVKTPTLFVHGRVDNEVPVSQAEEMYVALKKLRVETSFVQFLGEGHGWLPDLKPENKHDLYNRMIGWFDKYLRGIKD